MEDKKPLSPHIQIYRWHISSLVSITHRITGIINIIAITFICLWSGWLILGEANYTLINFFLNSFFGKFVVLGIVWSFSFQVLSEIRHLIMDMGYGFELQITRVTGLLVIFGSFLLTIAIYLIGRNFFQYEFSNKKMDFYKSFISNFITSNVMVYFKFCIYLRSRLFRNFKFFYHPNK